MGLLSSFRTAKWQAKVASRTSVYLEESQGVRHGSGTDINADEVTAALVRQLHQINHYLLGDPKSGFTGSLLPTVAGVLACGLTPGWSDNDKKYIRKALGVVLAEISAKDTQKPVDNDLLAAAREALAADNP